MEANDFWTFVGLVVGAFAGVVAPRMLQPGHTANTVTFLVGSAVVLVVAGVARARTRRNDARSGAGREVSGDQR